MTESLKIGPYMLQWILSRAMALGIIVSMSGAFGEDGSSNVTLLTRFEDGVPAAFARIILIPEHDDAAVIVFQSDAQGMSTVQLKIDMEYSPFIWPHGVDKMDLIDPFREDPGKISCRLKSIALADYKDMDPTWGFMPPLK
jgi:hypothetical protein